MKRFGRLLIVTLVLCLAIVPLAGCGLPEGLSQADYDEMQDENAALQAENTTLTAELATAQSELASLQGNYDSLNANYQTAIKALANLQETCLPRDFESISELEDWLANNDVSEEPAATSAEDLYRQALAIQEDALAAGYIVSANYDYDVQSDSYSVSCVTIIDGKIWYWDPQTDGPVREYSLGQVK